MNIPALFAQTILLGIAVGIALQFLLVLSGVDEQHQRRDYLLAAQLGLLGALLGFPVSIAMEWARTGEVRPYLIDAASFCMAILAVFYWTVLKRLNGSLRRRFFWLGIVAPWLLFAAMIVKVGVV